MWVCSVTSFFPLVFVSLTHHHHHHFATVKMRGLAAGPALSPTYFIVLDKLAQILPDRMRYWKRLQEAKPWYLSCSLTPSPLLLERLQVAADLASALEYVHSKKWVLIMKMTCVCCSRSFFFADWFIEISNKKTVRCRKSHAH